jgi:hypothetical protein
VLDFGAAADDANFLGNLSAIASVGGLLWTASDEGRTLECLEPDGDGFRLKMQVSLDAIFPGLPGDKDEADIESLDAATDRLLICGSHCQVRKKPENKDEIQSEIRSRPSRHLLGTVSLARDGALGDDIVNLPFKGPDSLREMLRENPFLMPFIDLPSKENGLDIEGCCFSGDNVLLGLRGPLLDSIAVVIEVHIRPRGTLAAELTTHFLDLGGLGVRELTRFGHEVLLIAGPVSSAAGPFRLYRWTPSRLGTIQRPRAFHEWSSSEEHPEGMCPLPRDGKSGLLILYDSPDRGRIEGTRYRADWVRFV